LSWAKVVSEGPSLTTGRDGKKNAERSKFFAIFIVIHPSAKRDLLRRCPIHPWIERDYTR